uniref:Uncharacterized protein n=1 Tax=viral metagenome TaxID=1070528 RepID=A0A6C0ACV7_9ZZZZ
MFKTILNSSKLLQKRMFNTLSGNTILDIKGSPPKSLKSLYESDKKFKTLSYNTRNNCLDFVECKVKKINKRSLLNIIFKNGSIKCSPDTRFITTYFTEIEASKSYKSSIKSRDCYDSVHSMVEVQNLESEDLYYVEAYGDNFFVITSFDNEPSYNSEDSLHDLNCNGIFVKT